MIVYHGSNTIVQYPDVNHSFHNLDFGKGFYTTTVWNQAVRWAKRKTLLSKSSKAYVNLYELSLDKNLFNILDFGKDMDNWIDFVCACRDGNDCYKQYDLIIGKVANDKVYRVVDMYHTGIWDKQRALKEIRAYPNYDQLAFITQRAINKMLIFKAAKELNI